MAILSRRTEAQSAKRRAVEASVFAATEKLLAGGSSYAELSVERIATEAGISRTAFYFYFRDKRELLMALTAGVAETLYEAASAWWADGSDAELETALHAVLGTYREHGVLLRAVVEASTYDEQIAEFWRDVLGRFVDATRDRLSAGGMPAAEAAMTAFSLCWMTERVAYQHFVQGLGDDDALVAALTRIWLRAV